MRLSILSVLFERYTKRVPQPSLFDDDIDDVEPKRPLMVDAGVADGARIHLLHKYDRPYYFGVDTLCDAGSENAEQFFNWQPTLSRNRRPQLIRRGNDPVLTSEVQHRMLRERAGQLIREWEFPQCDLVRRLADGIATECLVKSREGNAPLGGGANGVGIPQDDFDLIPTNNPGLARVIKFGVAYNAFALVRNHRTKNRTWCLIELGGVLLLHHGLTLKRGGFLERRVDDMVRLLNDGEMKGGRRWDPCIVHRGDDVDGFLEQYLGKSARKIFLWRVLVSIQERARSLLGSGKRMQLFVPCS